jgi:hypothetical protein
MKLRKLVTLKSMLQMKSMNCKLITLKNMLITLKNSLLVLKNLVLEHGCCCGGNWVKTNH